MSSLPEFFLHKREEREENWKAREWLEGPGGTGKICFCDYYACLKENTLSLYTTQVVMIPRKKTQLLRFLASFIWTRVFCTANFNFTTRFIRIFTQVLNLALFSCRLLPIFTALRLLVIIGITALSSSFSQCLPASMFLVCPPLYPSCPSWSCKSLPRFPIWLPFLSLMFKKKTLVRKA